MSNTFSFQNVSEDELFITVIDIFVDPFGVQVQQDECSGHGLFLWKRGLSSQRY